MEADKLRDLQELAHQLEELTKHPGWKVFVHYAHYGDGMMEAHQKRVLSGACKTPEDYQREAGWLAGAEAVLKIPELVALVRDRESAKGADPAE